MPKTLGSKRAAWLFLLPALVMFVIIMIVPIFWSLSYSLFHWDGVTAMKYIGLGNYIEMFTRDRVFWTAVTNNLGYMAINIAVQMAGGLLYALLLTKLARGRSFFQTLYYTPVVLSAVALAQVFVKFYAADPPGVVNAALGLFDSGFKPVAWIGNKQTAFFCTAIVEAYKQTGVFMVIFYSALLTVPADVTEAAVIDGVNGWQNLWYIKLPMIRPVIVSSLVLIANGTTKSFEIPYLMTGGGPGKATQLVGVYLYQQGFSSMRFGYASAIAVFLIVESAIIVGAIRGLTDRLNERWER